eukprot:767956-Hanusia_phi.AAC.11
MAQLRREVRVAVVAAAMVVVVLVIEEKRRAAGLQGNESLLLQASDRHDRDPLASYFANLPTVRVNAYHEPNKATDASSSSLRHVTSYAADGTREEDKTRPLDDKAALNDMLAYFDELPTTSPLPRDENHKALHPPSHKLSSKAAYLELGDYFDAVPTRHVNAFHSPAFRRRTRSQQVSYSSKEAFEDLGDYFESIPISGKNAFHQPAAEISAEMRSSRRKHKPLLKQTTRATAKATGGFSDSRQQRPAIRHAAVNNGFQVDGIHGDASKKSSLEASVKSPRKVEKDFSKNKLRTDWTALNDPVGPDPDAPTGSEQERHAEGYDTQYGLTERMGSSKMEETPAGAVRTHLVTRQGGNTIVGKEHRAEPAESSGLHVAVRGTPDNMQQRQDGGNVGMPPLAEKEQATVKPWAPLPYWKIIGRKGPLTWNVSEEFKKSLREAERTNPKSLMAKQLLKEARQHEIWRRLHNEALNDEIS